MSRLDTQSQNQPPGNLAASSDLLVARLMHSLSTYASSGSEAELTQLFPCPFEILESAKQTFLNLTVLILHQQGISL